MIRLRFLKLRMIWNIIRGRTVGYKLRVSKDGLKLLTNNPIVIECEFDNVGVIDNEENGIVG